MYIYSVNSPIHGPSNNKGGEGIMFSGCPSVSVCFRATVHASVRLGVSPVSMISYKPMDGISSNFGWRWSSGCR